ncbi:MAG: phosphoenolpyruvate synthase, partial [Ruminococcaceae bacterium]|nr:phosphoenolpyruvate synthase [Oscillospiraceae bacterium]
MIYRISLGSEQQKNESGNKAGNLVEMKKAGFNVPDGIVLDAEEYRSFVNKNGIADKISELMGKLTAENAQATGEAVEALFAGLKADEETVSKIASMTDGSKSYAVRSSATKEDLAEFSFAGQYKTFLNTKGAEAIAEKVIDCYRSMFDKTGISYIAANKIDPDDLAMAVVVQEMVDSELSGICFTVNPVTGNDKRMLIEVIEGLGENIVSGKVNPEQYEYDRYEMKAVTTKEKGLLDSAMLEKMGKVFSDIQIHFGYPCDIEFAVENNELYILQARSITKINYGDLKDIWTTADFKDGGVSASVCTPYMWSLYEYIWEHSLRKFILDSKILTEKDLERKLGEMYYGRPYWNLSVVKLAMSQVVGYREREFDQEYGIRRTYEGDGHVTRATPGALIHIARMALAQKKILKERRENAETLKGDLLKTYEEYKKNYDNHTIDDIKSRFMSLTHDIYLHSETTYFWQIFINTIHQSLYKDGLLKYVSESEYLTLLGSIDNISHMLPFYEMWDLSRKILNDGSALSYWKNTSAEEIAVNIDGGEYLIPEMKAIVDKFGYHSDKELDVTYPCYYEDPLPLIVSVKDMLPLTGDFGPEKDRKEGKLKSDAIFASLKNKLSPSKYNKIRKKVDGMRRMLWWREEFRDVSTRFYYLIRVYTVELSKKLVSEKVLEKEEDIWMLKVGNVWDYLNGKLSVDGLREIIGKNRRYYDSFRNFMSENEIGEIFSNASSASSAAGEDAIRGIGANNGTVTGTARVIY